MKKRWIVPAVVGLIGVGWVCCGSAVATSAHHALLATERLAQVRAMFDDLHLTSAQQTRIRAIVNREEPRALPTFVQMERNHMVLQSATEHGYNAREVQAAADREGKLVSKLIVEAARTKATVYTVLTPAQRRKVGADEDEIGRFVASNDFVHTIDSLVH